MAVTVILGRYSGGAPNGVETYQDGESLNVTDTGILLVRGTRSGQHAPTIAAYAPSQWVAANVGESRTFGAPE